MSCLPCSACFFARFRPILKCLSSKHGVEKICMNWVYNLIFKWEKAQHDITHKQISDPLSLLVDAHINSSTKVRLATRVILSSYSLSSGSIKGMSVHIARKSILAQSLRVSLASDVIAAGVSFTLLISKFSERSVSFTLIEWFTKSAI